jgi:toxin ParE1/3/4
MSQQVRKFLAARRDLIEIADFLEQRAGLTIAERFLTSVEESLDKLAAMPSMGSPWEPSNPRLHGIRFWAVTGFRKYMIFYREIDEGIELLRVLHGARDSESLLAQEPDPS